MWFEAGCCLLSRHRLQRLGRRRAARKCTLCACCCHFPGISCLRLSFPFFICPPLSSPPPSPNYLTCYPPPLALGTAWLACAVPGLLGSHPRAPAEGSRPPAPWGAGRPRDAGAAAERGPGASGHRQGLAGGVFVTTTMCALPVEAEHRRLRCSRDVAGSRPLYLFIYCFFFPRLSLLIGGSGRESRQLLPRSSPRRSRGLCSRSWARASGSLPRPLPTDCGHLLLRPGLDEGGLPAALPQPRQGWLWARDAPRPFLPAASSPFPAGQWLCQAASPCLGGASRRAGEGQTLPWSPAGGKRCEATQLFSLRPALTLSLLRPLSALGLRAKWEKWRKRESFFLMASGRDVCPEGAARCS